MERLLYEEAAVYVSVIKQLHSMFRYYFLFLIGAER